MLGKLFIFGLCVALVAGKSFNFYPVLEDLSQSSDSSRYDEGKSGHERGREHKEEGDYDDLKDVLKRLLYVPLPDRKGNVQGYFTSVPEVATSQFEYRSQREVLRDFRRQGLLPISDPAGELIGYFTSTAGGSETNYDVATLTTGLYVHGLLPVVNGEGKVVAIYSQNPVVNFGYEENYSYNSPATRS